uniref:THAP-type domain-containing protein n=1 Tax=Caenorhabditis tropicalis TaxID=1561998 RepID=A0A1I7T6G0_9PELO
MQFDSPTNEVALKEDKTVLMIGSLLLRELNRHQAHVFVETRRQKLFVCNFHFTNNVRVIFEFLGIKSIREAPKQEMMKRFMSTLNYFCPRMSSTEFMDSLGRFVRKYQVVVGRTETRAPASESLRQQSMKSHVVRPQVEDEEMKIIFYKTEKLVVFVGFILQGKYTLEQVQSFMDQERSLSIHRSDLRQMLRSIFDFLEIRNFRNINRYSIEKMDVLLPIVRSLNPGVSTPWQFCSVLSMFWARYQKEIELNSLFFK